MSPPSSTDAAAGFFQMKTRSYPESMMCSTSSMGGALLSDHLSDLLGRRHRKSLGRMYLLAGQNILL